MPKTPAAKDGPLVLGLPLASLVELAKAFTFGESGDRYRLASARIPPFLDLDFQAKGTRSAGNETEVRELVRKMAEANPLWGAPRIHGELLKLGIEISERTVSRLMPKRQKLPSQTWRAFLENHVNELISIDFFTVPTATFRVLFVFVVWLTTADACFTST